MHMRALALPLAAFLLLSACGGRDDGDEPPPPPPLPAETMMPVEPDGGIGDGAGPPPLTGQEAIDANLIPANFHGVWDYEGGTCNRASDMRMEISGSEILFYESIGRVSDVAGDGDGVIVTLDMEGEGETWTQKTRLLLAQDGDRLETSDGEAPRVVDEYPSKRCRQ